MTVPDDKVAALKDDFCAYHGWTATVTDAQGNSVPNPVTQNQFIKQKVIAFLRDSVKAKGAAVAVDAARNTAVTDADSISLT